VLSVANYASGSHGQLIQASAMRLLTVLTQVDQSMLCSTGLRFRCAAQGYVGPISIVVVLEIEQFPVEISGVPKRDLIEKLSPDGANESLHERMG